MPLTTLSPHQFEQYRPSGGISVRVPYKAYQYIPLCSVLTILAKNQRSFVMAPRAVWSTKQHICQCFGRATIHNY